MIYRAWEEESKSSVPKDNIIFKADCIDGMRNIPDESVNLIVTDPPLSYQLSQQ